MTAVELPRLRAHERAKRLVVLGLIVGVYAAVWLLVAWHASRVGETTCTIEQAPDGVHCKLVHPVGDGLRHDLSPDSCTKPSRWEPAPFGATLPCYYFRSRPDFVFFEPREIVWLTPGRIALLATGLVLVFAGLGVALRGARLARTEETTSAEPQSRGGLAPTDDPYRVAEAPPPPPPEPPIEPLVVPLSMRVGCAGRVPPLALFAFGVGGLIMDFQYAWQATGEVAISGVVYSTAAPALAILGLLGLGYRAGLVLDASRGLCFSWWGLGRPWFRRYEALASLTGAQVYGGDLELLFESGKKRLFNVDGDPHAAAANITAYLVETGPDDEVIRLRD